MKLSGILFFAFFSISVFAGCGGGGGGSSDDGSTTGLSVGSCALLGLNERVINGTSCGDLNNSPIVRIISSYTSGQPGYCSGTLISPTKVLTAGHCGKNPYIPSDKRISSTVKTGLSGADEYVGVTNFTVHPNFRVNGDDFYNDLAVVTLSHAINLPTLPILTSVVPAVGDTMYVYGYGRTVIGTPPYMNFNTLLSQALDLRSGTMVLSRVSDYLYRAENVAGQTSLCHGDSGSPLIYTVNGQPMIVGVTSAVVANDQPVHCAPGTSSQWTRLQNPSNLSELKALAPDAVIQ